MFTLVLCLVYFLCGVDAVRSGGKRSSEEANLFPCTNNTYCHDQNLGLFCVDGFCGQRQCNLTEKCPHQPYPNSADLMCIYSFCNRSSPGSGLCELGDCNLVVGDPPCSGNDGIGCIFGEIRCESNYVCAAYDDVEQSLFCIPKPGIEYKYCSKVACNYSSGLPGQCGGAPFAPENYCVESVCEIDNLCHYRSCSQQSKVCVSAYDGCGDPLPPPPVKCTSHVECSNPVNDPTEQLFCNVSTGECGFIVCATNDSICASVALPDNLCETATCNHHNGHCQRRMCEQLGLKCNNTLGCVPLEEAPGENCTINDDCVYSSYGGFCVNGTCDTPLCASGACNGMDRPYTATNLSCYTSACLGDSDNALCAIVDLLCTAPSPPPPKQCTTNNDCVDGSGTQFCLAETSTCGIINCSVGFDYQRCDPFDPPFPENHCIVSKCNSVDNLCHYAACDEVTTTCVNTTEYYGCLLITDAPPPVTCDANSDCVSSNNATHDFFCNLTLGTCVVIPCSTDDACDERPFLDDVCKTSVCNHSVGSCAYTTCALIGEVCSPGFGCVTTECSRNEDCDIEQDEFCDEHGACVAISCNASNTPSECDLLPYGENNTCVVSFCSNSSNKCQYLVCADFALPGQTLVCREIIEGTKGCVELPTPTEEPISPSSSSEASSATTGIIVIVFVCVIFAIYFFTILVIKCRRRGRQ